MNNELHIKARQTGKTTFITNRFANINKPAILVVQNNRLKKYIQGKVFFNASKVVMTYQEFLEMMFSLGSVPDKNILKNVFIDDYFNFADYHQNSIFKGYSLYGHFTHYDSNIIAIGTATYLFQDDIATTAQLYNKMGRPYEFKNHIYELMSGEEYVLFMRYIENMITWQTKVISDFDIKKQTYDDDTYKREIEGQYIISSIIT